MIIAICLFMIAVAVGFVPNFAWAIVIPIMVTLLMIVVWLARQQFEFFAFLLLVGYLLAFHSGYLLGAYLAGRRKSVKEPNGTGEGGRADPAEAARHCRNDSLH
jgi:hypothetical protein